MSPLKYTSGYVYEDLFTEGQLKRENNFWMWAWLWIASFCDLKSQDEYKGDNELGSCFSHCVLYDWGHDMICCLTLHLLFFLHHEGQHPHTISPHKSPLPLTCFLRCFVTVMTRVAPVIISHYFDITVKLLYKLRCSS